MLAFEGDEIFIGDGLGTDVALLKVGVNHAGGLGAGVTHMNGPGAYFFHTGGEIGLQAQERVGGANQAVQAGLGLAEFFQEHLTVFVAHFRHLSFHLGADGHHRRMLRVGIGGQAV